MTKQFWLNLPVKDIAKAKAFYSAIGFRFNEQQTNEESACMELGEKNVIVMLFTENVFRHFCRNNVTDTSNSTEVLLSIDAETRTEVDEILANAVAAGGSVYGEPHDQGWMYGAGFSDLDGHRWNILYMDTSKLQS
ncbi:MAG: VOC family protein [Bacteroidetes bacterium]|nr:VOC family protein [Bacteroidota bacterium]